VASGFSGRAILANFRLKAEATRLVSVDGIRRIYENTGRGATIEAEEQGDEENEGDTPARDDPP
jgi:hypothetical protein